MGFIERAGFGHDFGTQPGAQGAGGFLPIAA
jgi:hypothetical protein